MKSILVPLDGSPFGEHALPAALAVARRGPTRIDLVHVHEVVADTLSPAGAPFFEPLIDVRLREEEQAYLAEVAGRIAAVWDGPVSHAVLNAPISEALCARAEELEAGLIVLSTHGRGGLARVWLGSVADRLIRQTHLPILAVHPRAEPPALARAPSFERILIPLDGSPFAEHAIKLAAQVRDSAPTHYELVRVLEPITRGPRLGNSEPQIDVEAQEAAWQEATAYLEQIAEPLRAQGHTVMTFVPIGHPAGAILERAAACQADLIAMTTHGRSAVARMLIGSVADKVLRGTAAPLLIYRPPAEELAPAEDAQL